MQAVSTSMEKALDIVKSALTFGMNPSLRPIRRICALLGNPQEQFSCIQVAGTNGKSSTCRYLAALLRSRGYSTGLYTSPELVYITDRVEINGRSIDEESLARAIILTHEAACGDALELTEFELVTAAALWLFAEKGVSYAVLEAGLGGRWDATSVVTPKLAVLTGVDLDHTDVLGDTITEIAGEKAAIIKRGSSAVAAPTDPLALQVFRKRAEEAQATLVEVPAVKAQEPGSYQAQNKLTAFYAARELLGEGVRGVDTLNRDEAWAAMDATVIPGRLEVLCEDPMVLIDAAHNPASAATLAAALATHPTLDVSDAILLLAVLSDKDATGIIRTLAPCFSRVVVTKTASPRAIPVTELARHVQQATGTVPGVFGSPKDALDMLLDQRRPVVATGSITLAGEVRRLLLGEKCGLRRGNRKD